LILDVEKLLKEEDVKLVKMLKIVSLLIYKLKELNFVLELSKFIIFLNIIFVLIKEVALNALDILSKIKMNVMLNVLDLVLKKVKNTNVLLIIHKKNTIT